MRGKPTSQPFNRSVESIRRALTLSEFDAKSAQRLMSPRPRVIRRPATREGSPRCGGVLLLLFPSEDSTGELSFVLTKRTDTLANHKGQVSLPGGACEPGETYEEAALREANEELDIQPTAVDVIGHLTLLYIFPSDFEVYPVVAYAPRRPPFKPNPEEVAEVLEMPLSALLDETIKVMEIWNIRGVDRDVPFYRFNGHTIWGATAMILSEFEQRLRQVT
jgi:8-oxo-dGTP pyrophosphatase MutT (NUDIX family)